MNIPRLKEIVAPLCREYNVKRLDIFGSAALGLDTGDSDIDLLVDFREPRLKPAARFFGLLHQLEDIFHRGVDLYTYRGLRNPYFRDRVLKERRPLYEG